MARTFELLLWVMGVMAPAVCVALYFVDAGYGPLFNRKWGRTLNNKAGWVLMEAPVFIGMALLWWFSARRMEPVRLCIFGLFQLHYFQRAFIFPFLMRGRSRMPVGIVAMGMLFNVLNALLQGGWLFYVSAPGRYPTGWLLTPQFSVGTLLFFGGMLINLHSDHIIRALRKPGDARHYLPTGGLFNYVTSANYLGEVVEWLGFALLTWSWAGAIFAGWTLANLTPRAAALHKRYAAEFGAAFTRQHRKRILPFIY
jgi:3-oxo-5-alpha-steroid 4-dehydrogenase 1